MTYQVQKGLEVRQPGKIYREGDMLDEGVLPSWQISDYLEKGLLKAKKTDQEPEHRRKRA